MYPVRFDWWRDCYNAQVLEIERLNAIPGTARSKEDFICMLEDRDTIALVALKADAVVGFMVYQIYHKSLCLLTLQTHPAFKRNKIASQLIGEIKKKIYFGRIKTCLAHVRETDLPSQYFFRNQGFTCISVHRNWYLDTKEDDFLFIFRDSPGFVSQNSDNIHLDIQERREVSTCEAVY